MAKRLKGDVRVQPPSVGPKKTGIATTPKPKKARASIQTANSTRPASAPLLGAHLSVAGGLENAVYRAAELKCDCVQIFVKNQRMWRAKPMPEEQAERFSAAMSATQMALAVAHGNYLLNLASPNEQTRAGSIDVLVDELTRCERLGVAYLVFHPGAHLTDDKCGMANQEWRMTETEKVGIHRIAAAIDEIHARCAGFKSMLLLEMTAGQGSAIGYRFEHMRAIMDLLKEPERVGVCLDTCHLFAAGYDFRTPEAYHVMMAELDSVIGVARVKCIHTNDSKRELGSRVDRHDHIGKGKIGKKGFANFLNDPRWHGIPMILETPKGIDEKGRDLDEMNLKRLRKLVAGS